MTIEMTEISVKLPKTVQVKVQKQVINIDLDSLHDTAIAKFFAYGAQRYINDSANRLGKEAKAEEKIAAAQQLVKDAKEGKIEMIRAKATGADATRIAARSELRKFLKTVMGAEAYKAKFTDADASAQMASLDGLLDKKFNDKMPKATQDKLTTGIDEAWSAAKAIIAAREKLQEEAEGLDLDGLI